MSFRWLLFDVEGTITSLAFVHDVLFPFAARTLPAFLQRHATRPDVAGALNRVATETGAMTLASQTATLLRWIEEDRKHPDLKMLQGLVWEDGYLSGELRGHLYPDVVPFWAQARSCGCHLAIYSSGSVHAQRLLLTHSVAGDVASWIDRNFDTAVGPKADPESYAAIAKLLGVEARDIGFFSDVEAELDAAQAVGLGTCRVLRPGVPIGSHRHLETPDLASVAWYYQVDPGYFPSGAGV